MAYKQLNFLLYLLIIHIHLERNCFIQHTVQYSYPSPVSVVPGLYQTISIATNKQLMLVIELATV